MGTRLCIIFFAYILIHVDEAVVSNLSYRNPGPLSLSRQTLKLEPIPEDYTSPPPYMLHLYNRYKKGRPPQSTANTVRSFLPVQGKLSSRDVLVFNLTGIHQTEYIERADLHVHLKRPIRFSREKKSSMRLNILDLSKQGVPQMDSIALPRVSHGWHTLEITDSVITCLDGGIGENHLMGLLPLEGEELEKFMDISKLSSRPFLVVFSEDDDHMAIEDLGRRDRQLKQKTLYESNTTFSRSSRIKREILDNELPDYPLPPGDSSAAAIQARLKHKPLDSPAVTHRDTGKIKTPKGKHRKRRRRRRRKEQRLPVVWGRGWWKTSGRQNEHVSANEEGDEDRSALTADVKDEATCQRRELIVDLAEIGWSEWIISPNTFQAHYCAGICAFPMRKAVQPSNHATIQSLVHALGLHANVPRPCCVPQDLSPLTLLYYDRNRNVVIKSYPNMVVESCACR